MSTAASYIAGGTSLLGDIFNLFGQSKANREAEQFQTSVMDQQRQWALQDTAAANLYNSPAQQMQRLQAAKLNPNLIYGEGIQAAGSYDTPRNVPSASYTPQNTLASFSNLGQQAAEALNVGPNIARTQAQTTNLGANTANQQANTLAQDYANKITANNPEIIGLKVLGPDGKEIELSPAEVTANLGGYKMEKAQFETNIARSMSKSASSKAIMDNISANLATALQQNTYDQAMAQTRKIIADADLTEQQKENAKKQLDLMDSQLKLNQQLYQYKDNYFGNNPIIQKFFEFGIMAMASAL